MVGAVLLFFRGLVDDSGGGSVVVVVVVVDALDRRQDRTCGSFTRPVG
jgi:hypothetical protein